VYDYHNQRPLIPYPQQELPFALCDGDKRISCELDTEYLSITSIKFKVHSVDRKEQKVLYRGSHMDLKQSLFILIFSCNNEANMSL